MQYLLLHYGYAFLMLGLIVEGDATLVAAAILAGEGYFDLRWVIGLAMGVTVIGNELLYEIGATGRLRGLLGADKRGRVSGWLHHSRSGFLTLLCSRFMWGFRLMIPVAAGVFHIRRRRFVLTNLIGGVVWVLMLTYFGVALRTWFSSLHDEVVRYQPHVAVGLFLLGIFIGVGSIPWKQTRRLFRRSAITVLSLEKSEARPVKLPASVVADTQKVGTVLMAHGKAARR